MSAFVSKNNFIEGKEEKHDLEFRIDLIEDETIISLKLTSSKLRFRSIQRNFSAGTIISEREYYPSKKIIGTDIDIQVMMTAKNNVSSNVIVYQCDATKMKMKDKSISTIVSNIPWDVQIKLDDILKFYYKFLEEVKRVIKPGGKIILLTDKTEELFQTCNLLNLKCKEITILSLHGLQPAIFEIKEY